MASLPQDQVADVMNLLYRRGLVSVTGGNASIYDPEWGVVYISPTGKPRHLITPSDIAIIDLDGRKIRGSPSSEWRMHVAIYKRIPGARAVVHAHGVHTITLSTLLGEIEGLEPNVELLGEAAISTGGCVALAKWAKPGTWELAEKVASALADSGCRAAIMERHGAVAYSEGSIYRALDAIEALEDLARLTLLRASILQALRRS